MTPGPSDQIKPTHGILLMLGAITVFSVMSACIKAVPRVPAGEAMFFRSFMALPVIVGWLIAQGKLSEGIRTVSVKNHVVRGIVGSCAMGLGFAGLRFLPLPEVTAIRFATPVVLLVLAALMLGERLRLFRISAVLVGLVGVVVIIWPRLSFGLGSTEATGVIMVLASAVLAALAQVFVKGMSGTESTSAIVFWFSCTTTAISLLTIPFGWVLPTPLEAVLLISAGIVGGLGQILLTSSYRFADAGVLAPFTYVSMLWSLLIGYVWFDEVPTWPMMIGAALVIGAGVIIVWRENKLGKDTTARRKVRAKGLQ